MELGLLKNNIISLDGEVNDRMIFYLRHALANSVVSGSPDIQIIISSRGGDINVGLGIYDLLRLYKGKTTGTVTGFAHSIAAIFLQACDNRQCLKHSEILIHNASGKMINLDVLRSKKRIKKLIKDLKKTQAKIDSVLMEKTGQGKKEIQRACKKASAMTAEEALEFGLIDEIV